jgi:hypothetical protein
MYLKRVHRQILRNIREEEVKENVREKPSEALRKKEEIKLKRKSRPLFFSV